MDNQGRFFGTPALKAAGVAAALGLSATVGLVVSKGDGTFTVSTGDATSNDAGVVTVTKVNGITYPSGSLTTGTVPRATGTATVAYGALDLANTNAVTGALPNANQAAQTLAGDVTGNTSANTVERCSGDAGNCNVPSGSYLSFGDAGTSTGDVRFGSVFAIRASDGAGNNINLLSADAGTVAFGGSTNTVNHVHGVKTGGTHKFQVNATDALTVGGGYVGLGSAAVASAGDVRFGASGSQKALNGSAADINLVSWASGIFTYGGTVNTGMVFGTSTAGTHSFQVNGVTQALIGTGYLGIGTGTLAGAGELRHANATTMAAFRNAANSADVAVLASDSSNNLYMGGISGGTLQPANTTFGATTQHNFSIGATAYLTMTSSAISLGPSLLRFGSSVTSPVFTQATQGGDSATQAFTIQAQSPFASATGANRAPGDLKLTVGTPTNSGTTHGSIRLTVASGDVVIVSKDSSGVGTVRLNTTGQNTVGTAGGASALPATPSRYLQLTFDDGNTYVVPGYATH